MKKKLSIGLVAGLFIVGLACFTCQSAMAQSVQSTFGESCVEPEAPLPSVTLYFAGTGLTEEWWDKDLAHGSCPGSGFFRRESLATLHKWQIPSATQKKTFIDGIGTGCNFCLLDLLNEGFPEMWLCRGWQTLFQEAEDFLINEALPTLSGKIILNLVGFSRGGIAAIRFANMVPTIDAIKDRVEKINILAYEPAAGSTSIDASEFILNDMVAQYVGFYATDERAAAFSPSIPDFASPDTKVWMIRLPGTHETLAGNSQTDGHSTNWNWVCGFFQECFDDELLVVSWVTTFIAEKLLGSSQWGNLNFNLAELGLEPPVSDDTFIQKVDEMNERDYSGMRLFSVSPVIGFELCKFDPDTFQLTYAYYSYLDYMFYIHILGGDTHERCTDWYIDGDPPIWTWQLIETGPYMPVDPLTDGALALDQLQELTNSAPVANGGGPYKGEEGAPLTLDASCSSDPDGDPLLYRWDFDNDGNWDTAWSANPIVSHTWGDDFSGSTRLQVNDGSSIDATQVSVTISNVPPTAVIDSVDQPNQHFILPIIHTLTLRGSFTDPGWLDTHDSYWDLGDGSNIPGTLTEENTEPDATGQSEIDYVYSEPGTYTVYLDVNDDDGGLGTDTASITVITAEDACAILNDYIRNLAETSFINNADQRKKAISNKLKALGRMIEKGEYDAAIDKLNDDIRAKLDGYVDGESNNDWIVDEQAQGDICLMIDDLVVYLEYLGLF